MRSIIQNDDYCMICTEIHKDYSWKETEEHHVFFGPGKRFLSDEDGLVVYLCKQHHTAGIEAVHNNRLADLWVKAIAQARYEETHTRADFIKRYGRSYL